MKLEFYIPKDQTIPTRLRLKVDGLDVYYDKVNEAFAYDFTLWGEARKNGTAIVDEIVRRMCNESYDHGSEWRVTKREIIEEGAEDWEPIVIRVYFRIKDSY